MADKIELWPKGAQVIETVEMHTGGEPLRIIVKGYPEIKGNTILDKRRFVKENLDFRRTMLMAEPRGHSEMYGALLVSPDHQDADLGVLFLHNEGYSTMCGHAMMALGRYAVDSGLVVPSVPETTVKIQCPCGLVCAHVECDEAHRTGRVRFESVPSFAFATDQKTHLKGYGSIEYDVSFGGTFYAIVDSACFGMDLSRASEGEVQSAGKALLDHLRKSIHVEHPEGDLAFLYGVIVTDGQDHYAAHRETKNVAIFGDGQVDRSPCGSGVQARLALQFRKGLIPLGEWKTFVNALTGSEFQGRVLRTAKCGAVSGVVVEVSGQGFYSGTSKFFWEDSDPLKHGFLLS